MVVVVVVVVALAVVQTVQVVVVVCALTLTHGMETCGVLYLNVLPVGERSEEPSARVAQ